MHLLAELCLSQFSGAVLLSSSQHVMGCKLCGHCRHQKSISASLKDADVSIRRRALDLLFTMCNTNNAPDIVDELLRYLEVADFSLRDELVLKTAILAERWVSLPGPLHAPACVCALWLAASCRCPQSAAARVSPLRGLQCAHSTEGRLHPSPSPTPAQSFHRQLLEC